MAAAGKRSTSDSSGITITTTTATKATNRHALAYIQQKNGNENEHKQCASQNMQINFAVPFAPPVRAVPSGSDWFMGGTEVGES